MGCCFTKEIDEPVYATVVPAALQSQYAQADGYKVAQYYPPQASAPPFPFYNQEYPQASAPPYQSYPQASAPPYKVI